MKTVRELLTVMSDLATVDATCGVTRVAGHLREDLVDLLAYSAVFGDDRVRSASRWLIREMGRMRGVIPASIQTFYEARGREEFDKLTVPAMNIRGLTYDVARAIIRAANAHDAAAFIFEIARSEIGYTQQRPDEYAAVVIAAALREGYAGPLFIQGDHFQLNAKQVAEDPEAEVGAVRALISEAVAAGFYNIDIDASTLVDLSRPTVAEQQKINAELTAELTAFIRALEPDGIRIGVGGEIGEVGGTNTTEEEFTAFMTLYAEALDRSGCKSPGICKISVQTGTSHGGVPLPDGTVAQVAIDFATLERISRVARETYGLAGAVQHGASTLPMEAFGRFVDAGCAEVHLATEFQNIIYDHPAFPADLKTAIYDHLRRAHADERAPGQTEAQFLYKTRKRGFGPFKQALWDLPEDVHEEICRSIEAKVSLLFDRLGIAGSARLVRGVVDLVPQPFPPPEVLREEVRLAGG